MAMSAEKKGTGHFVLIVNTEKDPGLKWARHARDVIESKNKRCDIIKDLNLMVSPDKDTMDLIADAECAVVLGGDGTLLRVAGKTVGLNTPLLGVNLGNIGYLTEVETSSLDEALLQVISGDYYIEERMMLAGNLGTVSGNALNDIVIARSGALQMVHMDVSVNGSFIAEYQADGMIVSTPTGSTAYNLSAGGPIVSPDAKAILLTPISPHSLANRCIVLSPDDSISIRIKNGRDGAYPEVDVTFDGSRGAAVKAGDIVNVCRSDMVTRILRLKRVSFLDLLRKKLT